MEINYLGNGPLIHTIILPFLFELDDFGSGSEYERLTRQVGSNIQQISNNGKNFQFLEIC